MTSGRTRLTFDGWIVGLGTASGTRIVLGHWPRSPYGAVSDVMVESPNGERRLLAATAELGKFVAATYQFDRVEITPVRVARVGHQWSAVAGPLMLRFASGPRPLLGWLLRTVPAPLARTLVWAALVDGPARVLLPGVRTRGTAGSGRREWYCARDLHPITAATVELGGRDLGPLADIDPPVRFGFGSTPRFPALVRVTTTVEVPAD